MQAVVVTFDRLATRLVGCYGNEWIETPHIDRLATMGTVFDNHITDSVGDRSGWSWLAGRHAIQPAKTTPTPIGEVLRKVGVTSQLILANSQRSIPWDNAQWNRIDEVTGQDGLTVAPTDVPIAKLIQAGIVRLTEACNAPRLLWLHAPEPGLPPEGFATLYFEDFEERGLPLTEIPQHDWHRQIAVAAGSMSLVDHWLGELLQQVALQQEPTLILIAAAAGRSWMEDFVRASPAVRKDTPADVLRSQEVGSPLMLLVQCDDRYAHLAGHRCPRFVQPVDIAPTLFDWFGLPLNATACDGRSLFREAICDGPARTAVYFGDDDQNFGTRTQDWNCLIRLSTDHSLPASVSVGDSQWPDQVQLFAKPEDIWDVTDLATQMPDICEGLVRSIGAYQRGDQIAAKADVSPTVT